jgi:hypothetical protein
MKGTLTASSTKAQCGFRPVARIPGIWDPMPPIISRESNRD